MDISWADKIRALEAAGWSQTALGDAIELSASAISDIKNGRTREPTGMSAVKLHHLHSIGAAPPSSEAAA